MALFLKLVCCSFRIQHFVLLKFWVVRISRKSFLNDGLEYDCLSVPTVVELLEPSSRVISMYSSKKGVDILG